jgi:hypothetical protein
MEQIKKLCRKADQTRTIHSLMRDQLVLIETFILAFVTIGSAISAMLIFSPLESEHGIWVGLLSALIFIVSLIPSTFDFRQKILARSLAVQAWGKWILDAKNISDDSDPGIKELTDRYKAIMEDTPLIPDRIFNKYKQKHLQKIAISKALDETPFKKIKDIKKELSK